MKFSTAVAPFGALLVATVASIPIRRSVDPSQVPEFGVSAGQNPNGSGSCVGINNILIPCSCPPDRQAFINSLNANVAAGHAVNNPGVPVSFPSGNDAQSAVIRIQASLVTLQNLNGPGVGCPASATTFSAQLNSALAGNVPAAAAAPPPPPPAAAPPAPAPAANGIDPNLVPQFGVQAGQQPNGSGSCVGLNGKLIPCSCPPDRQTFINKLAENVAAGHAINNPGSALSFPTGNDAASAATRITAAIITLQNLNGPGVGCPAVSTTFSAQLAAAQGGNANPSP